MDIYNITLDDIMKKYNLSDKEIEIYKKDGDILNVCNFSTEAAIITGVKPSAIRNNLAGLSKSAGGYIFKYKIN